MEAGAEHPRARELIVGTPARRLVGIDLGTTNSAVAWVDASAPDRPPHIFNIVQLVARGEISERPCLPSFLYFPTPEELDSGAFALPWDKRPDAVAGVLARDHGALAPARQVASAKSWLSNASVDRRAAFLPAAAHGAAKISPVDASARLLAHLRDAWNATQARDDDSLRLERQAVVLAVPASFDAEARELTVEAARGAGFEQLTLLEEPLAAVYSFISQQRRALGRTLRDGQLLLVCDVGGGTTDFSLLRGFMEKRAIRFERIAIGEHLLLGGDNLDLALAARVETLLAAAASNAHGARLDLVQRQVLRRQCSAAKERLLTEPALEQLPITVLGSGRAVVSGTLTADLTRADVVDAMNEFLPLTARDDRPARKVRHALRELGLPYESEPAITRHLSAFLADAARGVDNGISASACEGGMLRPDAVLFNGGFFSPPIAPERIQQALERWFGRRSALVANRIPEAAVAIGAAFYAALRHSGASSSRLLIRAGSARSHYVGVRAESAGGDMTAVCVLTRGSQEGTQAMLDHEFSVVANQPAVFTLYSATDRQDALNDIVTFTNDDRVYSHAPLITSLRFGQRSRRVPLNVRVGVVFTEVGTLELWCESRTTEHRWRLQFGLRAKDDDVREPAAADEEEGTAALIPEEAIGAGERLIRDVFQRTTEMSPDALIGELERVLGHGKHGWPLPLIRRFADVLSQVVEGRRLSAGHEARWLNLAGFCLRPGFGTALDPWRISEIRKLYAAGLAHPNDTQSQVEWLILWQRVSGGFTATQQQELARRVIGMLGLGTRKPAHLNSQMLREAWRLLGGLERLDAAQRARLGDELAARVRREPGNTAFLTALGRFGGRVQVYGPLNSVVAPDVAERWLEMLLALKTLSPEVIAVVTQIGARTDDPVRDIGDPMRETVLSRLLPTSAPADIVNSVQEAKRVDRPFLARLFDAELPVGLQLNRSEFTLDRE